MTSPLPALAALNLDSVASAGAATGVRTKASPDSRMRAQAESFEVQFVNSMFQQMYSGIKGDGPFGNSTGVAPWRSFLTEEYAKSFVKAGGVGITDAVYKSLLSLQEAHAK